MSKADGSREPVMSSDAEEIWSTISPKALHPLRVPMIEALWRINEPLSSVDLVDVLDGFLSMWDALFHLRVLETLDVVEPLPMDADSGASRADLFGVRYQLKDRNSGKGA